MLEAVRCVNDAFRRRSDRLAHSRCNDIAGNGASAMLTGTKQTAAPEANLLAHYRPIGIPAVVAATMMASQASRAATA